MHRDQHERLLSLDTFADIFLLADVADKNSSVLQDENQAPKQHVAYSNPESVDLPTACQLPRLRPGPKPFFEQFPELVTVVTDFVKLHGFSAEARRRSSVGNMMGVSLKDIVEQAEDTRAERKGHITTYHSPSSRCTT